MTLVGCVGHDHRPSVGQCSAAPTVSSAAQEAFGTTATCTQERSSSATTPDTKFARNCNRSSTRQSHRARSRDLCPRQRRRCSSEVVAGNFAEGQTIHPCCTGWGAIGCVQPIHRACQEAPRQSRRGVAEASHQARGNRVGRRASSIRSAARRSRIGGHH